jgi:hypothetical protein
MKNNNHSATALLLALAAFSSVVAGEPEDKGRIWETFAVHAYSNLNATVNGELTPVFRSLGDFGELQQYFDQDQYPKKYEAYRQFIVQVFADAIRGDVGEAMFANVVLEMTPTRILLPMIAPEIEPQGKLHGILDGKGSDVAKRIERRSQVIYEGNVNFDDYVSYLKGGKDRGYTTRSNAEVIVEHMFRTEPQKAFIAMLWADYGFLPYAKGNCYLYCKEDSEEVRKLQLMQADIKDYLFRSQYSFPVAEEDEARVKAHLKDLSQHGKAWVRLYLVCLMENDRNLRFRGVIDPLANDQDDRVRAAVGRINSEYPPFWKD